MRFVLTISLSYPSIQLFCRTLDVHTHKFSQKLQRTKRWQKLDIFGYFGTFPETQSSPRVRKLWGLHSVSFTLLAHSERPRLIGGSEVSMEKKTEREKIDRSNQSGSILF